MFSCFSSDFWCVPTTPAAGTAGEAAGWASWHRRALLAPRGWPTPAQIKAGESTELAGCCCWRCGECFSKLACSKITEAGSLLDGSSSQGVVCPISTAAPRCWMDAGTHSIFRGSRGTGAGWAVQTSLTRVFGGWTLNPVTLRCVPSRCHTSSASHPPCRKPEPRSRPNPSGSASRCVQQLH